MFCFDNRLRFCENIVGSREYLGYVNRVSYHFLRLMPDKLSLSSVMTHGVDRQHASCGWALQQQQALCLHLRKTLHNDYVQGMAGKGKE